MSEQISLSPALKSLNSAAGSSTLAGRELPALLHTANLCYHLGVSTVTIWRWIRDPAQNFPKPIEVGARVRMWRTAEIEHWLNTRPSTSKPVKLLQKRVGHD